jgi:nucleoside-diphosphate-sugar epimerase
VNEFFENKYGKGKFETVVVKALNDKGAFDDALKDVAGVVHVATDVSFSTDADGLIEYAIHGVQNLMDSAGKQSSIKSVVLTSSSVACYIPQPNKGGVVDESMPPCFCTH